MKSQYRVTSTVFALFCLLLNIAVADSVVKTLYIDGVYIGEAAADAALSWPYNHILIGAEGNTGYRYNGYKGKIDEFAIYSGVLSSTRIAAHYNALVSGYAGQVTSDNPLLYLRFDDPNMVNGAENSGSVDVDGTYIDGVTISGGAVGNAAEFHGTGDGGVGDSVDISDQTEAFSQVDVTIELWMNSTADPNDYPRLFQHNGSWESSGGYGVMLQTGQVGVMGGGNTSYFNAILADGNWHHVVVTYDSTIDPPTPYVDAVVADNPLAYYRFEDASGANGAVCADSATRAYKNGEYINLNPQTSGIADIALVSGMAGLGQAAQLNGDDGIGNGTCISIFDGWSEAYPTTIARNEDGTARQTLSIEFWMNSSFLTNYPRLLQHNDGGAEGLGIGSADGQLTVMGGNTTWYAGTGNVFNSQWHHVVVTYQPGTEPNDVLEQIYIDGVSAGSNVVSTGSSLSVPTDFLTLGNNGSQYYVSNGFKGLIDEVAFYDTVLDAQRVWTHYSAATGIVKPYEVEIKGDNPVLYMQFEDGQTPKDSSANNYFVEYGASSTVQEAMGIGNAIYLNGSTTSGYAAAWNQTAPYTGANGEVGDLFAFTAGDITFECWAKLDAMANYGMMWQQIGPYTRETFAPGIANSAGTIRILNGNGGFWYTNVVMPINDGKWHHFVVTYDEGFGGNAYAMRIQFYLDGALKGQTTVGTSASPAKLGPELNHILIGGENDRGSLYNTMTGLVDEFAIYDGILSADRVTSHYDAGVVGLAAKSCAQVWIRGQGAAGDINKDCRVDLADFEIIASSWLLCNDPTGASPCAPTW